MEIRRILSLVCPVVLAAQLYACPPAAAAAEVPGSPAVPASSTNSGEAISPANTQDLQALRERIAEQEQAIRQLQQAVQEQRTLLERAIQNTNAAAAKAADGTTTASDLAPTGPPTTGDSAPAKMVPVSNAALPRLFPVSQAGAEQHQTTAPASPLGIKIGSTTFTPLGFVDATFFARSTNLGSGIATNFTLVPYNNSVAGRTSETNFSAQNSRIGFRVDSTVLGAKVLGYFEADFLGQTGPNSFVTSNSNTFRMRNVFVDVQKDGFEVLGGQDWSMFTPNRKSLSPIPADIFLTQNVDTNYQVGLPWSRQAQFRFIAHPNKELAFGVSLENPQQYTGGSVAFPAAYSDVLSSSAASSEFNNGLTGFSAPNAAPDIIVKGAYDGHVGDKVMHVEAGALIRNFKDSIPLTAEGLPASSTSSGYVRYRTDTATAVTGEVNANLEVFKNVRIIANTFFGAGGGRYLQGNGPDLIVRADGTISPVHTYATLDGFEANITKNTLISVLYGGAYFKRNVALDTNGKYIGYGYTGSANSNNRNIQEITFDVVQTLWKNPSYGALSLIGQYSYLFREPWFVAPGGARNARTNMYYLNLRYTLP
jgi:uncharacterized coiled-coil protein SlyX